MKVRSFRGTRAGANDLSDQVGEHMFVMVLNELLDHDCPRVNPSLSRKEDEVGPTPALLRQIKQYSHQIRRLWVQLCQAQQELLDFRVYRFRYQVGCYSQAVRSHSQALWLKTKERYGLGPLLHCAWERLVDASSVGVSWDPLLRTAEQNRRKMI